MSVLPNLITLMRLFLVPVVVWLMLTFEYPVAFAVFVLAGISDGIDGYLARKFDARSRLGAVLDPLADKVLLVAIFIALGSQNQVPLWFVILMVSRDSLIIGAILLSSALNEPVKVRPILSSKINTALQIILAATVLASLSFDWPLVIVREVLVWSAAATTVISGFGYLIIWLRNTGQVPEPKKEIQPSDDELGAQMIDLVKERQGDVVHYRERFRTKREEREE